eukprot:2941842-Alexandrium_andersonii.AAC.1
MSWIVASSSCSPSSEPRGSASARLSGQAPAAPAPPPRCLDPAASPRMQESSVPRESAGPQSRGGSRRRVPG